MGLGETARAVDGVEAALRPPEMLVFSTSREGREEAGPGEWPREEAIEGRGEDNVDMVGDEEVKVNGECGDWLLPPAGPCLLLALPTSTFQLLLEQIQSPQWPAQSK